MTVIQLAEEMGYKIKEMTIPREMVYIADEMFFTGTAAEVTPIRSVDKQHGGRRQTRPGHQDSCRQAFFDIVKNGNDPHKWLNFVYEK